MEWGKGIPMINKHHNNNAKQSHSQREENHVINLRYFSSEERNTSVMMLYYSDHASVVMNDVKTDFIILCNIVRCISVARVCCRLELSAHHRKA